MKRKRQKKCEHIEQVITCPVCLKLRAQKQLLEEECFICGATLHPKEVLLEKTPEEKALEDAKLEEFKAHMSKIVDFTREIEEQGIISASVENFLKTAEELREKLEKTAEEAEELQPIPSDVPLEKLCQVCLKRYNEEQAAKGNTRDQISDKKETKQEIPLTESAKTIKSEKYPTTPSDFCELHSQVEADLELGTFETEIKEITKIIRVKNEDGTVTEERKTVKIKKEIRAPIKPKTGLQISPGITEAANPNIEPGRIMYQASDASTKSNPYPTNKTVQRLIMNVPNIVYVRFVKSDLAIRSTAMTEPVIRTCISSISKFSLLTYLEVCNYASYENLLKESLVNLTVSSSDVGCTSSLIETSHKSNEPHSICNVIKNITVSERELIMNELHNDRISKSTNDINKKTINTKLRKSVSLNIVASNVDNS